MHIGKQGHVSIAVPDKQLSGVDPLCIDADGGKDIHNHIPLAVHTCIPGFTAVRSHSKGVCRHFPDGHGFIKIWFIMQIENRGTIFQLLFCLKHAKGLRNQAGQHLHGFLIVRYLPCRLHFGFHNIPCGVREALGTVPAGRPGTAPHLLVIARLKGR